jgi:uncharacterized delta-60 repeat protein
VEGRLVACLGAALLLLALALAPSALAQPGSLDRSFGERGWAIEDLGRKGGEAWPSAVVVQPDGRAVVATGHRIVRFQGNGKRDRSFVDRGLPVTDLVGLPGGGLIRLGGGELERVLPDGSADPGFAAASGGTVSVPGLELAAVAADPEGRLVAVGHDTAGALAVARFLPDGQLDPGFGSGGVVRTAVSAAGPANLDVGRSVAVGPDGRILVGGSAGNSEDCTLLLHCWGPYLKAVVLRYLPDGALDDSFGQGGVYKAEGGAWGSARSVVARPDGGALFIPGPPTGALEPDYLFPFAIAALTTQGQPDRSFSADGVSDWFFRMRGKSADQGANELAVTPRGEIVACGWISRSERAPRKFLVGLLGANGSSVGSFGRGGFARTRPPGKRGSIAAALALAPNDKVYVAGALGHAVALARYRLR